MAQLPLLKLSGMFVKYMAKPVAARIKVEATKHPKTIGKWAEFLGQTAHQIEKRLNVLAAGYKFLGVKPLPQEEALNNGIGFISEGLVISITACIIIIEYKRSADSAAEKAVIAAAEKAESRRLLEARFTEIENRLNDIELHASREKRMSLESYRLSRQKESENNSNKTPDTPKNQTNYFKWLFNTASIGFDADKTNEEINRPKETITDESSTDSTKK